MVPFIRCKESLNTTPGRAFLRAVRGDLTVSFLYTQSHKSSAGPAAPRGLHVLHFQGLKFNGLHPKVKLQIDPMQIKTVCKIN